MNVEERHVEKDREDDEADGSGHEVFDGVEEGVAEVAENVPQLDDGEDADVEDHKETNKLDRDGPAQHRPGQGQPQPPGAGERGEAGAAELGHGEHWAGDEEEEDGVGQDVAGEGDHANVEQEEGGGDGAGGEARGQLPDGEEGEGDDAAAEEGAANMHAEVVVVIVQVAGLLELMGAVVAWENKDFIELIR